MIYATKDLRAIRTYRAFTLIELLVVISIISLLMGILLPALGSARRAARNLKCQSNMRQWGIAINAYTIDSNDYLPSEGWGYDVINKSNASTSEFWFNTLPPYVGLMPYSQAFQAGVSAKETKYNFDDVWFCPEAIASGNLTNDDDGDDAIHYHMNAVLNASTSFKDKNGERRTGKFVNRNQIKNESMTVFLIEGEELHSSAASSNSLDSERHNYSSQTESGNINFLFLDGHVSQYTSVDIKTLNGKDSDNIEQGNDGLWKSVDHNILWGPYPAKE